MEPSEIPAEHESAYVCTDAFARVLRRGPVTLTAAERLKPLTGRVEWAVAEETGDITFRQVDDWVAPDTELEEAEA